MADVPRLCVAGDEGVVEGVALGQLVVEGYA